MDHQQRGYSLPQASAELRNEVFAELRQGRNISAIALYRNRMNVGLAEGKFCVELLIEEMFQRNKSRNTDSHSPK